MALIQEEEMESFYNIGKQNSLCIQARIVCQSLGLSKLKLFTGSLEWERIGKKNEVKKVGYWGRFHFSGEVTEESF